MAGLGMHGAGQGEPLQGNYGVPVRDQHLGAAEAEVKHEAGQKVAIAANGAILDFQQLSPEAQALAAKASFAERLLSKRQIDPGQARTVELDLSTAASEKHNGRPVINLSPRRQPNGNDPNVHQLIIQRSRDPQGKSRIIPSDNPRLQAFLAQHPNLVFKDERGDIIDNFIFDQPIPQAEFEQLVEAVVVFQLFTNLVIREMEKQRKAAEDRKKEEDASKLAQDNHRLEQDLQRAEDKRQAEKQDAMVASLKKPQMKEGETRLQKEERLRKEQVREEKRIQKKMDHAKATEVRKHELHEKVEERQEQFRHESKEANISKVEENRAEQPRHGEKSKPPPPPRKSPRQV